MRPPARRLLALGVLAAVASGCAARRPRGAAAPEPRTDAFAIPAARPSARGDAPAVPDGEAPAWTPPSFGDRSIAGRRDPLDDAADRAARARLVAAARALLGSRFRGDCSAYVLRALRDAGVAVRLPDARTGSEALYRAGRDVPTPRPGDLAFFHDTYDRNRDRKLNDRFTHVALVEQVDGASVVLLHRGGRGVRRLRMDLSRPGDAEANDPVRVRRRGDARGTRYLTGELFAAFGELLGRDGTQMLQASRASDPGARHPAPR